METADAVHDAPRSSTLRRLAGGGLVLQLARRGGASSADESTADPTGALAVLAGSTARRALLVLLAVGFAALTVRQAVEVLRPLRVPRPRTPTGGRRSCTGCARWAAPWSAAG